MDILNARLATLTPDTRIAVLKLREWVVASEDLRAAMNGRRVIGGVIYPTAEMATKAAAERADYRRGMTEAAERQAGLTADESLRVYLEVFAGIA